LKILYQKKYTDGHNRKTCSTPLAIKEMQIKTTVRCQYRLNVPIVDKEMKQVELSSIASGDAE
jgi:hypothetical protein